MGLSLLGPIKLAFITSSRKVFSVLASILVFSKPVSTLKLSGIALVVLGMALENMPARAKKHDENTHEVHQKDKSAAPLKSQTDDEPQSRQSAKKEK